MVNVDLHPNSLFFSVFFLLCQLKYSINFFYYFKLYLFCGTNIDPKYSLIFSSRCGVRYSSVRVRRAIYYVGVMLSVFVK